MLIQERVKGPDVWLKLFVTIEDWLTRVQTELATKQLPRATRGGPVQLSASEVVTLLGGGAWHGLADKATLYSYVREYHNAIPGKA